MTPRKPIDGTLLAAFTRFQQLSCYWQRANTTPELAQSEMQEYISLSRNLPELIKRLTAFASLNTEPRFEAEARVIVEPPRDDQGWRYLIQGETVQTGDECWHSCDRWTPCDFTIGTKCDERQARLFLYRRRVTPPATEYRMLQAGEMIQAGDEWDCADGKWMPIRYTNEPLLKDNVGKCRRKVVSNDTAGQGAEMEGKREHEADSGQSGASEDGWRFIQAGEAISQGDEWGGISGTDWQPASMDVIGMIQKRENRFFRRRIPAKHPESDRAALGIANLIERETM